jgi:hypothetical protein
MITLNVTVSNPREEAATLSPVSRGGTPLPATAEESRIRALKLFVFDSDSNRLEQYRSITIRDDDTSDDPLWDATTRSLRVAVTPGPKRVYCIANWAHAPTAEMPDVSDRTVTDTASLLAVTRIHAGVTPVNPPVMSGRLVRNIAGNEKSLTITLTRQVAMARIYPMLATMPSMLGAELIIEGVKFTRLAGQSYLFGRVPAASPVDSTWDQTAFAGAGPLLVTATTTAAAVKYPLSWYIPENIAPDARSATCMIVKARYNGTPTYYTVVLNGQATSPHGARYSVERDHCYDYYLTIRGIGAATARLSAPTAGDRDNPGFKNIQLKLEVR